MLVNDGNTVKDTGLYELYENVVQPFVEAMIEEAERYWENKIMEIIKRIYIYVMVAATLCVCPSVSSGRWLDPTEIISGGWGVGETQFGIEYGDTVTSVPGSLCVNASGNVYILDAINTRIKVYSSQGMLQAIVKPINVTKVEDWPLYTICDSEGNIYTLHYDNKLQKYAGSGQLLWELINIAGGKLFILPDDSILISGTRVGQSNEFYLKFSTSGQLMGTYSDEPVELGIVKDQKISSGRYKLTVKYPNKIWGLVGKGAFPNYVKDSKGNLYGIGETQVARYNDCGKEVARLTLPAGKYEEIIAKDPGIESQVNVIEEYGSPVLAPNGDVYTWKRTPDKYSILKWTWQDDPNVPANVPDAPTDLKVTPSTTSLALTWKLSFQDPGCVTGYEILRSTTSGAGFSTVVTVDKSVLKYEDTTAEAGATYYYKVRASGGDGFSEYSNEASGKR